MLKTSMIKNNWLTQSLDPSYMEHLLGQGQMIKKVFHKGEVIFSLLDVCNTLNFVLSGKLTVNRYDTEGNIVHIAELLPGDSFGGILLYASRNFYPFEVAAASESTLLTIKKECLFSLLHEHPDLLKAFLTDISDQSTLLARAIHALSEKSLRQKIRFFLAEESQRQGSTHIQLTLPKRQLAERFGVARTSLFRELKAMQDDGLIQVNNKWVRILSDL